MHLFSYSEVWFVVIRITFVINKTNKIDIGFNFKQSVAEWIERSEMNRAEYNLPKYKSWK